MATNFYWSGYDGGGAITLLTTELNSLASSSANTLSTLGGAFTVPTGKYFLGDIEFLAGGTLTPVAPAFIELWLLVALDGTNYEDGSASIAPGRPADAIIPVRAGTTITPRAYRSGIVLPPNGVFKPILRNQCGASLPASGNTLRIQYYTEQY